MLRRSSRLSRNRPNPCPPTVIDLTDTDSNSSESVAAVSSDDSVAVVSSNVPPVEVVEIADSDDDEDNRYAYTEDEVIYIPPPPTSTVVLDSDDEEVNAVATRNNGGCHGDEAASVISSSSSQDSSSDALHVSGMRDAGEQVDDAGVDDQESCNDTPASSPCTLQPRESTSDVCLVGAEQLYEEIDAVVVSISNDTDGEDEETVVSLSTPSEDAPLDLTTVKRDVEEVERTASESLSVRTEHPAEEPSLRRASSRIEILNASIRDPDNFAIIRSTSGVQMGEENLDFEELERLEVDGQAKSLVRYEGVDEWEWIESSNLVHVKGEVIGGEGSEEQQYALFGCCRSNEEVFGERRGDTAGVGFKSEVLEEMEVGEEEQVATSSATMTSMNNNCFDGNGCSSVVMANLKTDSLQDHEAGVSIEAATLLVDLKENVAGSSVVDTPNVVVIAQIKSEMDVDARYEGSIAVSNSSSLVCSTCCPTVVSQSAGSETEMNNVVADENELDDGTDTDHVEELERLIMTPSPPSDVNTSSACMGSEEQQLQDLIGNLVLDQPQEQPINTTPTSEESSEQSSRPSSECKSYTSTSYEIEKVIDKFVFQQVSYYLIKWTGYEDSENSWQAEELFDFEDGIEEFERNREKSDANGTMRPGQSHSSNPIQSCQRSRTRFQTQQRSSPSPNPASRAEALAFKNRYYSGRIATRIITLCKNHPSAEGGAIMALVEWTGKGKRGERAFIPLNVVKFVYPELVISYFESNADFQSRRQQKGDASWYPLATIKVQEQTTEQGGAKKKKKQCQWTGRVPEKIIGLGNEQGDGTSEVHVDKGKYLVKWKDAGDEADLVPVDVVKKNWPEVVAMYYLNIMKVAGGK